MSDKLHRFLIENLHIRGEWVSLTKSWQAIQQTTTYPSPIRNVLGEALAAISLLAESLKFDGSLTLQIRGTEPVTLLVVQANSEGNIRGIARWQGDIADDLSFNQLFGAGTMVISVENNPKMNSQQGERYQSLVSLEGDSLANCFKEYFAQSEQLKSRFWLAANEHCAAGMMLQSLPSASDSLTGSKNKDESENAIENSTDNSTQTLANNWDHVTILADTLTPEELLELDAEQLLTRLYHEEDLRLYDAQPIQFKCTCSQEKIENTIHSLGEDEVNDILAEQGLISIDCEFCNAHYELDSVDVKKLFIDGIKLSNESEHGTSHGKKSVH